MTPSSERFRRPARFGGFTLIELLVVLSILGLLVAILLPALAGARATARAIECGAHLQQAGVAMHTYAEDHKSYMVPSAELVTGTLNLGITTDPVALSFDDLLDPYLSNHLSQADEVADHIEPEKQTALWVCPADYLSVGEAAKRSYATTGRLRGTGYARANSSYGLKLLRLGTEDFRDESGTFMITEYATRNRDGVGTNLQGSEKNALVETIENQDPTFETPSVAGDYATVTHGSDGSPLFNYLHVDGHVNLLAPLDTVRKDEKEGPIFDSGAWTRAPQD